MSDHLEPTINIIGFEEPQITPDWIKVGAIVVCKYSRLVAEIVDISDDNKIRIAFDDTGETIDDYSVKQLIQSYEEYSPGIEIRNITGTGKWWGENKR
jgi:hypothetical protein